MKTNARGFTLVEMVVAVAVSTTLVAGVYSALVSTTNTADRQQESAVVEAGRTRAIELLRGDLRGRAKLKVETVPARGGAEPGTLMVFATTSDSLGGDVLKRSVGELRYTASSEGLKRREGDGVQAAEITLAREPVVLEFWSEGLWRKSPKGEVLAIRAKFVNPSEIVAMR